MINLSEKLKERLHTLPELPGVYKMLDSQGNIIYIGKSKCLKKRVKSYFVNSPKWEKVNKLVRFIEDIEYEVTDTHLEARLLECELIKNRKPSFNSQMKHDKNYVYLKVDEFNNHSSLSIILDREDNCYGPFRRKFSIYDIIDSLKHIFPMAKTAEGFDFEYHIFPLTLNKDAFETNKTALLELFSDVINVQILTSQLEAKMKEAASSYKFETASKYRDMIEGIKYLSNGIFRYDHMISKDIILKIPVSTGYKLFFVSKGQILYKEFFPSLSNRQINSFIKKSKKQIINLSLDLDDKAGIDFRDIIYSEILSLPKECILETI
jgi:excinuclease ABC subunit C